MASFEELKVYQEARGFRKVVSSLSKSFPAEEKYRLVDQIIRSSRSVSVQIAEGYGRFHYQESIQYMRVARGSLDETHEHINVAFDEGYIDDEMRSELLDQKLKIMRMINGYNNYLKKSKRKEK